jgi:hypothetical protein
MLDPARPQAHAVAVTQALAFISRVQELPQPAPAGLYGTQLLELPLKVLDFRSGRREVGLNLLEVGYVVFNCGRQDLRGDRVVHDLGTVTQSCGHLSSTWLFALYTHSPFVT